jgi:hypothetical protein
MIPRSKGGNDRLSEHIGNNELCHLRPLPFPTNTRATLLPQEGTEKQAQSPASGDHMVTKNWKNPGLILKTQKAPKFSGA